MMRPGIGAVVTELDRDELEELLTLRAQLEPPLIMAATARSSQAQFDQLRDMLARMGELASSDLEGWCTEHYLFHRRIFEFAGRPHSLRLATQVLNMVEPYQRLQIAEVGPQGHDREHAEIVAAMRAGDASGAAALATAAIAAVRQELSDLLLPATEEDPLARLRQAQTDGESAGRPTVGRIRRLRSALPVRRD